MTSGKKPRPKSDVGVDRLERVLRDSVTTVQKVLEMNGTAATHFSPQKGTKKRGDQEKGDRENGGNEARRTPLLVPLIALEPTATTDSQVERRYPTNESTKRHMERPGRLFPQISLWSAWSFLRSACENGEIYLSLTVIIHLSNKRIILPFPTNKTEVNPF